jgi:hypothetical protein
MSICRIILFSLLAIAFIAMAGIPTISQYSAQENNQDKVLIAGRNVNMVLGDELPDGDPWLQRQNEPSIAVSTRNPLHILAAANDYRTVDLPTTQGALPGIPEGTAQSQGDAWLGIFKSFDGGESWISTLLPGYPQSLDETSPLYGYNAAADPVVRAGTDGLFYVCGIVFQRDPATKEIGESAVFVARYRDNNNKEKGDTIEYLGAEIVFQGNSGQFFDKPWMAVDIPRGGSCGNIYVVASDFVGNKNKKVHGKVYASRSTDCGETWGKHVQLTDAGRPYQGGTIAIDPEDGTVYVVLRRFKEEKNKNKSNPDSILVTRSDNYGKKFGKLVEVGEIDPFDQPTSPLMFRTNCYPTMTVDENGIVYVAWSERGWGPNNEGRIVISTSTNRGNNWSSPVPVESPQMNPEKPDELLQGHQFMPTLTCANGKLMLAWYDSRYDKAGNECLFEDYIIDDPGCEWRHTIDVRIAQANPGSAPVFEPSTQVSRYIWVILEEDGEWFLQQAQWNPPNFPLFQGGTTPFHGDYIDISPSPMFIWDEAQSKWRFNTEPADSPVFHVAWTDNRDVKPPLTYPSDWTDYTPTTYTNPDFDSEGKPECGGDWRPAMRNQNVYTSRISQGLEVGSIGNSKPLNILRAFIIEVDNTTDEERTFRLAIGTPEPEGQASFLQFGLESILELDVTIAAHSSISRPVFFQSSDPNASVRIDVIEIDEPGGNSVPGGLAGFIILNPGDQDAVIEDPDGWTGASVEGEEAYDSAIGPAEVFDWIQDLPTDSYELNPNMFSPNMFSPNMFSPNMFNTVVVSPNMFSPNMFSPNMFSPNMFSPNMFSTVVISPNMFSPNMFSPNMFSAAPEGEGFENARVVDVLWKVTNEGNATSSYTFKTFAKDALPEGIYVQLIVFKTTQMPITNGEDCALLGAPQDELLANIINPNMFNPNMFSPNMFSPNMFNAAIENATFSVPPGDEVNVVLRLIEENPTQTKFLQTGEIFDLKTFAGGIGGGVTPQQVNTKDAEAGIRIPRAAATYLVIGTAALSDGTVEVEYTEYVDALGGDGNYSWSLNSGELPDGLTLTTTQTPPYPYNRGMISGTPTTEGTYYFVVQVDDASGPTDTQFYKITIHTGAVPDSPSIATPSSLPNAVQGNYYGVALEASGGQLPYIWTMAPGSSLPDYLTLDEGGVISGRPEAVGTYTFTVQVTDQDGDSDTKQFSLKILESAQADVAISGMVYDENGNALNGVVLRGLPNTPITGSGDWADGYYEDTVPSGWTGTARPFKLGYSFIPDQTDYNQVINDQTTDYYEFVPLFITTEELPPGIADGVSGCGYYPPSDPSDPPVKLEAAGGVPPYTWSILEGEGTLPPGLDLNPDTGVMSGIPQYEESITYPFTYGFTVQVTDYYSQTADKQLGIEVSLPDLGIGTPELTDGVLGQMYTESPLIADCAMGTLNWSIVEGLGTLPPVLSLDPETGVISGTPEIDEVGGYPYTYNFTVEVTDSVGARTASKELSIRIAKPLEITSPSTLPYGLAGVSYGPVALSATGGIESYQWPAGPLGGTGLSIDSNGVISGTPTAGVYTFPIELGDSASPPQWTTKEFTIVIHLIAPPTGLISWWPGDDNALDYINGNHGTLYEGTTYAEGMFGDAFSFDGIDDYVLATGTGINELDVLTIELWVKMNSLQEDIDRFVTIGPPGCPKACLRHEAGGTGILHFYMCINSTIQHIWVDDILQTGCWHHVAGTYDGSVMRVYLDGVEVGNLPITGTVATGNDEVYIGYPHPEGEPSHEVLDGLLDEVKIYDHALDATEIQDIYAAGNPNKMCTPPPPYSDAWPSPALYDGPASGNEVDVAYAIAIDSAGNIYVVGNVSNGTRDFATIKYNGNDGSRAWIGSTAPYVQDGAALYDGPGGDWDSIDDIAVFEDSQTGDVFIYVTGWSTGDGTNYDYATIKYNGNDGSRAWTGSTASNVQDGVARYDGGDGTLDYARAITVDSQGDVYVTGKSGGDFATIKYDGSDGSLAWSSSTAQHVQNGVALYDGPANQDDGASSIAIFEDPGTGDISVYVTGSSWGWTGDISSIDYATIKYDGNDGSRAWMDSTAQYLLDGAARFNGPENAADIPCAIALDPSGNVYVTGRARRTFEKDEYATIKYNSYDGSRAWHGSTAPNVQEEAAWYGGPTNYQEPKDIAIFEDPGTGHIFVYVTGWSEGDGTAEDYTTIKYDGSDGSEQWPQALRYIGIGGNDEDRAEAIAVDMLGNVCVTGWSYGGTSLNYDMATVVYDSSGEEIWIRRYAGPDDSFDSGKAIAVDSSINIYVAGHSNKDIITIKYKKN